MSLSQLATRIEDVRCLYGGDTLVNRVALDSRVAQPGDLFVAQVGVKVDGHKFVRQTAEKGVAVAVTDPSAAPPNTPALLVGDSRSFASLAAHALAGDPTGGFLFVGVTGTNGKTSVIHLVEAILTAWEKRVGVIGTIDVHVGDLVISRGLTTPDAPTLIQLFAGLKDAGCDAVVMEVSSHGLDQKRVDGCRFDAAIFTNLSRDHLDYHITEQAYADAKRLLFSRVLTRWGKGPAAACINMADPRGAFMADGYDGRKILFGDVEQTDVRLTDVVMNRHGLSGVLRIGAESAPIQSPLLGRFQAYNIEAAAAACHAVGAPMEIIADGLTRCHRVPGRLDKVSAEPLVLVDYAHTPDALVNALSSVTELAQGRIITAFGCGGDRDRGKRPLMGKAAAAASDIALITSDNPRTEDPLAIIDQIIPGAEEVADRRIELEQIADFSGPGRAYAVEPDRARAIEAAILAASARDLVLIAGKGHEDYQILGEVKHHFDDREQAIAALAKRGKRKG